MTATFYLTARRSSGSSKIVSRFSSAADALDAWFERRRSRRFLASLDDRMLRDVGLSAADVDRECSKPFWRA